MPTTLQPTAPMRIPTPGSSRASTPLPRPSEPTEKARIDQGADHDDLSPPPLISSGSQSPWTQSPPLITPGTPGLLSNMPVPASATLGDDTRPKNKGKQKAVNIVNDESSDLDESDIQSHRYPAFRRVYHPAAHYRTTSYDSVASSSSYGVPAETSHLGAGQAEFCLGSLPFEFELGETLFSHESQYQRNGSELGTDPAVVGNQEKSGQINSSESRPGPAGSVSGGAEMTRGGDQNETLGAGPTQPRWSHVARYSDLTYCDYTLARHSTVPAQAQSDSYLSSHSHPNLLPHGNEHWASVGETSEQGGYPSTLLRSGGSNLGVTSHNTIPLASTPSRMPETNTLMSTDESLLSSLRSTAFQSDVAPARAGPGPSSSASTTGRSLGDKVRRGLDKSKATMRRMRSASDAPLRGNNSSQSPNLAISSYPSAGSFGALTDINDQPVGGGRNVADSPTTMTKFKRKIQKTRERAASLGSGLGSTPGGWSPLATQSSSSSPQILAQALNGEHDGSGPSSAGSNTPSGSPRDNVFIRTRQKLRQRQSTLSSTVTVPTSEQDYDSCEPPLTRQPTFTYPPVPSGGPSARSKSRIVTSSAGVRPSSDMSQLPYSVSDGHRPLPAPPATTAPLLSADELVWGTLSYRALSDSTSTESLQINYFSTMLPHELKIAVFRALQESYVQESITAHAGPGRGRWEGLTKARRELVRLSRVSREWRDLCFDGQLWINVDLTPFSGFMHPSTLRHIILQSRPFIRTLILDGLDAMPGFALTDLDVFNGGISNTPVLSPLFASLHTLDLRGCHSLTVRDLVAIVKAAPELKVLSLKGCKLPLSYVLQTVAKWIPALEELDVSRCSSLAFGDIEYYIGQLSGEQRNQLHSLRIAGLPSKSLGHLFTKLAVLPNLYTLDLQGCRWVSFFDIQAYVHGLAGNSSPLRHLVLSGCTHLSAEALGLLVGHLPHIEMFEAAGLDPVFYLDPPPTLAELLRTMPKLRKLDLDTTGKYGGVTDRTILELIPGACPGSPLQESQLEELHIGSAKLVSVETLVRLASSLPKLRVLHADATEADNSVLRAFINRNSTGASNLGVSFPEESPPAHVALSLVDCHRVTMEGYTEVAPSSRARAGWDSYQAIPFGYNDVELDDTRPVIKTFWAWRRVGVPLPWREARVIGEWERDKENQNRGAPRGMNGRRESRYGIGRAGMSRSWFNNDDVDDLERGACLIQ